MSFQLAYPKGQDVPRTIEKPLAAAQSWEAGAHVIADASDNWAECGADPASVGAIAIHPVGVDSSGFNILARREFPSGKAQCIPLTPDLPFTARYVGSLPANNGGTYGVVRDTDLQWKIDFAEVTTMQWKLVDRRTASPENIARVVVIPLVARIQIL